MSGFMDMQEIMVNVSFGGEVLNIEHTLSCYHCDAYDDKPVFSFNYICDVMSEQLDGLLNTYLASRFKRGLHSIKSGD